MYLGHLWRVGQLPRQEELVYRADVSLRKPRYTIGIDESSEGLLESEGFATPSASQLERPRRIGHPAGSLACRVPFPMRTLLPMPAAQILLFATVAVLVLTLLIFARRFHSLVNRLEAQLNTDRDQQDRLEQSLQRIEEGARVVAENLQASVDRADATDETIPGKSADAALRTGDTAEAIRERQDAANEH